jgi:pimeloyl-ACP methyl ester carboxylesterase
MPLVTANNIKLHYLERGQDNLQTTVMVHGLGDNLSVWYLVAGSPQLSAQHLVLYDLRGHGKSELAESGYDLTTLASDLEQLVGQLAHGFPINLVGNSLGSTIALKYVVTHPDKVSRLVLVEPTLPPYNYDENDPTNTPDEWMNRLPPESKKVFAKHPFIMSRVANKYLALKEKTSVIKDLLDEPPFHREQLERLNIPTLVISASRSNWGESAGFVLESIPGAVAQRFEASHFIMLEATKQVAGAIAEFLEA